MPAHDPSPTAKLLFVKVRAEWERVDEVRQQVERFCAEACTVPERNAQLALAAHELVQNAIAYASAPGIELELAVDEDRRRVGIAVSNHCAADRLAALRARLARIEAEPDPLTGYISTMREAPSSPGGIGLARVHYEAGLDLSLAADGDRITVRATGSLAPPGWLRVA